MFSRPRCNFEVIDFLTFFNIFLDFFNIFSYFSDDATSDFSSKSGTPSPILGGPRVPHGVIASRDLVRDFRESSVHSRSSSHGIDPDQESFREESVPREMDHSQRHPSPFNRASMSSLGVSNLPAVNASSFSTKTHY